MSATNQTPTTAPLRSFSLLVAPLGELSQDGQLRELIEERRQRLGADVELWYLGPDLVEELRLGQAFSRPPGASPAVPHCEEQIEAIVAGDAAVITWLQLRFGGCAGSLALPAGWLQERAGGLPPRAPAADTASRADRT
ncbi:hypothetical protein KBY82_15030 [Cyanobium sp. AMD-g]|uniref:hypothetical protein n=1 Tax=Cyanobium sp. AMD-g TaxID=2823699 RepID=UPI0020CCD6E8|nr:hypothetical protein [Cyanobium sp. AMD-g]MCP9932094.1 hypothetical protein [Cyanobium sp. AMD-g]